MINTNYRQATPSVTSIFVLFFAIICLLAVASCRVKSGCPTDQYRAKVGKNGNASTKRGKTNLFPKDMRRKMNAN